MRISNKTEFLPQFRQLAAKQRFPLRVSPCGICDGKDRQCRYKHNNVGRSRKQLLSWKSNRC